MSDETEAAEMLGTSPKRATTNGTLPESDALARRRRFVEMLDAGVFRDLGDPEVMAGAYSTQQVKEGRIHAIRCDAP